MILGHNVVRHTTVVVVVNVGQFLGKSADQRLDDYAFVSFDFITEPSSRDSHITTMQALAECKTVAISKIRP